MKNFQDYLKIIHKEGYIFIASFAAGTFLCLSINSICVFIGIIATCWCIYFFRNPERFTPVGDDLVISPADGVVQRILICTPPAELNLPNEDMLRISIFLNVFNVHVNRVPASGTILQLHYNPGKFFNASLDKASIYNERQSVLMETDNKVKIGFVQIAGLIARRIVCDLEESMTVKAGERFGIIRFGSRMDVYLPVNTTPLVGEGQIAVGGETILADLSKREHNPISFEIR